MSTTSHLAGPAGPAEPPTPALRSGLLPIFLLSAMFAFFCAWSMPTPSTINSMARVGLTHAIVAHGRLDIDEIAPAEIDRAHFKGHFYCDKAPGVSLMCVVPVLAANVGMDFLGWDDALLKPNLKATPRYLGSAFACLWGVLIPLSAIGVVRFNRALLLAGVEPLLALAGTMTFAFGTPFLYWSASIFGHATATALLMIGFCQYWLIGRSFSTDRYVLFMAGFTLAMAVTVEFLAAPVSAAIGLAIAFRVKRSPKDWGAFRTAVAILALGGAVPAALLLGYNYLALGSPFRLGYGAVEGWEGMKTGFFGISSPSLSVLWELTFGGYRGILWISPVILPAIYGCAKLVAKGPNRMIGLLCLSIGIYYFCINAGYYYWDGGWSTGPRHVTPSLGFLIFGLALAFPTFSRSLQITTIATAIYSIIVVIIVALVDPKSNNEKRNVIFEHILPDFASGKSHMFLVGHGLPFFVAVCVPFFMLGIFLFWFFWLGRPELQRGFLHSP